MEDRIDMPRLKGTKTGRDLAAARLSYGVSARAVARAAGVAPSTVLRWEKADLLPRAPTGALRLIARVLRVRLNKVSKAKTLHGVLAQFFAVRGPCGARTRKGSPCRKTSVAGRFRCRFHGGLSTGPRTFEGRSRVAEAQRQRWARWRAVRDRQESGPSGG